MTKIDLSLDLPANVAREAGKEGLLSPHAIARLLRAEIKRRAAQRLIDGAARATAAGSVPMSMAEIQKEVDAVRKARREGAAGRE